MNEQTSVANPNQVASIKMELTVTTRDGRIHTMDAIAANALVAPQVTYTGNNMLLDAQLLKIVGTVNHNNNSLI